MRKSSGPSCVHVGTWKLISLVAAGFRVLQDSQVGGCQNYGPFLGTLNNRVRTTIGTDNHPSKISGLGKRVLYRVQGSKLGMAR